MLRVETEGAVATITLARPEVKNALDDQLIAALSAAFSHLGPDIRAVVLTGDGNAFCAGGDLQWMRRAANYTEEENYRDAVKLAELFRAIVECPAVVIAKVHGAAFGGGCGLVAAADVAIASTAALFAFSEVKLGLVPATISRFVIPKIGVGNARALFSTGEAFGAERALQISLVHEVVESDELDEAARKKLKSILAAGPEAVAISKKLAQQPLMSIDESARLLARARAGDEAREGVAAFLEKRPARFVQKL
jgi:enoyl-CoA hydratase/carnithine racemase